ncbi:MAG: single-stranded-DNA-specific exonuclease RecJ [Clostridiales bacterium]
MTQHRKWQIRGDVSGLGLTPTGPLGLLPLTAELLALRGYQGEEAQKEFLNHKGLQNLSDFWRLPDMAQAVEIIRDAIIKEKKICIFGDYDADGMTATALLIKALASLGNRADYYIPHRLDEGYGLNKEALRIVKERGAELLITVDCGISAVEEAAYAKDLGLALIITDHHRPPQVLPEAAATINPELMAEPGKSRGLAGAGVAFALAACLYQRLGGRDELPELSQLAAIGTLADGMPLAGDNRILVAEGLTRINKNPLPGIKALLRTSGLEEKTISGGHITFTLAPRLNAAGRMGDPSLGVKLLLAQDMITAQPYAGELEAVNKSRQEMEGRILEEILDRLDKDPSLAAKSILILAGEDWHMGVIGITAARLLERFGRPAILISFDQEGVGRGSGRSLPGCNLHEALTELAGTLLTFGGHELACGFQLTRDNFEAFREKLENYSASRWFLKEGQNSKVQTADLTVSFDQLTLTALEELELLAPFGAENPQPLLVLPAMELMELKALGQERRHYKLFFRPAGLAGDKRPNRKKSQDLVAIAFSMEENIFYPQPGQIYDLLFQPEINQWQGRRTVQALLRDFRLSLRENEPAQEAEGLNLRLTTQDWTCYQKEILGEGSYRPKQIEALQALAAGENTLLVMATGRGKTAVFQTAAAALSQGSIAIFIYPLRSLARDQERRMAKTLEPLGIHTSLAWGGLDHWQKKDFFKNLYQGNIRLIITTAEFLQAHLEKFKPVAERIGLFVADEAHHLGMSHRQAYKDLANTWRSLGRPLFLATTATADEACAAKILRDFKIGRFVAEEHCRENLSLADARDREDKLAYLLEIIQPESKIIVYVNSRRLAEELAGLLQDSLPRMKNKIAYYHGGLLPALRQSIEGAFLAGDVSVLVSTSAFGEGADIPDIRDVVLYHLCFSRAEYNQLSGRAGRDGKPARIHLLYQQKDQELNRLLLKEESPDRGVLGGFYLYLREQAAAANPLVLSDEELAGAMAQRQDPGFTAKSAAYCLGILEEIALLLREEEGGTRYIHLAPPPPTKLDLNHSSLYKEGQESRQLFEEYVTLAFSPDPAELLAGINRPILPEGRRNHDSGILHP